jgi:hypothetical protein
VDDAASIDTAPIVAVVDTNVMIDIHSCHDFTGRLHPALAQMGDGGWLTPGVWYRGTRARDALLLTIYLDQIGATTWGSNGELLDKLTALVPPSPGQDGGKNWELDFATLTVHFVRERVLSRWTHAVPVPPEKERGNQADQWLVHEAKRLSVPLITNDGLKTDGTIDDRKKGTRTMAKAAGVMVVTPREFFQGKLDEAAAADRFRERFNEQARLHVQGRTDQLDKVLQRLGGYYDVVLYVHAMADEGFPTATSVA